LRRHLLEKLDILGRESVEPAAGEIERAESEALGDERNTADTLQAFLAKDTHDVAGVAIELRATGEKRLPGGNGCAGGRGIARDGDFLLEQTRVAGEIERMNLEQAADGIEEREAGVVVKNDALQSGDNAAEDFREFTAGDENVVDLEKDLQAVTLVGELCLLSLRSFEVERVVHGDGNEAGDPLHELNFGVRNALGN